MKYEIPYEISLIMNFFNGNIYFVFENEEEVKSFLNFIEPLDKKFNSGFCNKAKMKSALWKHCKFPNNYNLEWSDEEKSFAKDDAYPVSYSFVRKHTDKFAKMYKSLSEFWTE